MRSNAWRRRLSGVSALVLALFVLAPGGAAQVESPDLDVPVTELDSILGAKQDSAVYIVQLPEPPVVSYEGDISGLGATAVPEGRKVNPNSRAAREYVEYLTSRHDAVLASVGGGTKVYDYVFAFNGFSAVLTPMQAAALSRSPHVTAVWIDELRQLVTENSPGFLGLTEAGGLWDLGLSGEDVIIGVIDTGIWPEHPSFSDQTDLVDRPGSSGKRSLAYGPAPAGWHGTCQSGEQWSQDDCNNKLIGARYFLDGFGHHGILTHDYKSARDADGHGSHTASTAGGNGGVEADLLGVDRGTISGMAPRARLAAYKACWNDEGCFTSDLAMAIDTAVADGVDVINYSIGSSSTGLGPDDIAFLFAADAGVFVATSAGNDGPGAGTIGSPAWVPWVTTVGASTQNRTFEGSVTLGDSATYLGASVTPSTDPLGLVDSADVGSELCIPGDLDPALVTGKIVLCLRGEIARVDKSYAVSLAGGAGMILYNANDSETQNTDNHFVPSVHIDNTDGLAVKAYIAADGPSATAQITGGNATTIPAPWMADFSSRSPNGGSADLIKPDVTAPGVNILAGNTPSPFIGAPDQLFQAISGTSMSSPHIAGIGALLTEAHPDWTPEMVKSALMTTADPSVMKEDGSTPADPFDMGAGHVAPNPAVEPGLAYDAGLLEYLGFLCDAAPSAFADPAGTCSFLEGIGIPTDASDLNYPSIGIGSLAGIQTIVRTVHDVGGGGTYEVSVDTPPGVDVIVSPTSLTLAPGTEASYAVTFTSTSSAVFDDWAFGSLTWENDGHAVRSPIAVQPVALAAPSEISGSGTEGTTSFDVTFGYTGAYAASVHGLVAADTQDGTVVDDPADDINVALATGVGITLHFVDVPVGTEYARFSLFDEYTDGEDDLDLYVFGPDSAGFPFVGGSGSPTSAEQVDLESPDPGVYIVVVHGWQTDGPDAAYTLFGWNLPEGPISNMAVTAPGAAVLGATESVGVAWPNTTPLTTGMKYLGSITHHDVAAPGGYSDGLIGQTIVRIDTD